MKIYNSLTRKIEELKPLKEGKAGVYICGPTVYDYAHIGHARTYVNSDVLVRALKWLDFKVMSVMNITDVGHLTDDADQGEDKMEKKAREEKKDIFRVAKEYTKDFWQMAKMLNIKKPTKVVMATDHIKEMVKLIEKLEIKGYVYKTSDGVYFDTSKSKDYGKLAKIDIEGIEEGARVKKNPEKKNSTDFALWKFSPKEVKRQMEWDSPWGKGFPGWHIECSAMSMKYLGDQFDIHTGGIDHLPIHHPNEIAQSEAATGKRFVNYWFHSNHMMVEGEKMSKSKKNYIRVKDVKDKGYDPLVLRYLFLTGHYRTKTNFSYQALDGTKEAFDRLRSMVNQWSDKKGRTKLSGEKLTKLHDYSLKFREAVENDLNMPQAMAVVFMMAKSNIPEHDKYELILDWDQVLGLGLKDLKLEKLEIPSDVKKLADERLNQRQAGKFEVADQLRQEIEELGFTVEDDEGGYQIRILE